jgi:YHS domain-containing protein
MTNRIAQSFGGRRAVLALGLLAAASAILPSARAGAEDRIYTGLLSSTAVGGYDPVAYFREGKPVEGSAEHASSYAGATWRFASAANKAAFDADPARYAPAYGGHCAWAAAQGYLAKGDPKHWRIVDGRLYLNYDAGVQTTWEADIPGFIKAADAKWPEIGRR